MDSTVNLTGDNSVSDKCMSAGREPFLKMILPHRSAVFSCGLRPLGLLLCELTDLFLENYKCSEWLQFGFLSHFVPSRFSSL